MEQSTVVERFKAACEALIYNDAALLEMDASERSIASKLASYLAGVFPAHHVDFEYNRAGVRPKRIDWETECGDGANTLVIPDIIVHRRGENSANLAVCEVKKSTAGAHALDCDREKLREIKSVYSYDHAILLVVPVRSIASIAELQIEVVIA